MKTIATALLLAFIAILSFQCRKEISPNNNGNQNSNGSIASAPITSTLQGNVLDDSGQPSPGVLITVGNTTATTDSRGYFKIVNAALDKNASLVSAKKAGYFTGYRTFRATSGVNQVTIQLIKRTLAGSINAGSGGSVTLSNGSKVLLPANGVVIASGNTAYSGTINVYASYLDPTGADISKTIPGSFMGYDKTGNRVALSSYGMLIVELESSAGAKLQMATGSKATLTTHIPSSLQSSAPATISLWYVDEQTGLWQEQGTATKKGDDYVGDVQHFSYWNCDYSISESISFTASFKTSDGSPLVYTQIKVIPQNPDITDTTYNYYGYAHGYTDSLGQVSGYIPANVNLTIEVLDNCQEVFYKQNVGPFISNNTDLGIITIPRSAIPITTVKGKLIDCSNNPVTKGYATIYYNDYFVASVGCNNTGDFSANLTLCAIDGAGIQIVGTNETIHQQGNIINVPRTASITDAGSIVACGNSAPYWITLKGKLVDCNNVPVSNGVAVINYGYNTVDQSIPCNSTGDFSVSLLYKPDSIQSCRIGAVNIATLQQGSATYPSLTSFLIDTVANVGNIIACGTSVESNISYSIDGVDYTLLNPLSSFSTYSYLVNTPSGSFYESIGGFSSYLPVDINFSFQYNNPTPGTYTIFYLSLPYNYNTISLVQPFNVTITNFAQNVGDYFEGSFSGQFIDSSNLSTHTITCSFKQPKTQ